MPSPSSQATQMVPVSVHGHAGARRGLGRGGVRFPSAAFATEATSSIDHDPGRPVATDTPDSV